MKLKHLVFLFALSITSISYSQCPEEKQLAKKYQGIADTAQSWDIATPAILCAKYYRLLCDAKQDAYNYEGKTYKRSKQEAFFIEERMKAVIEKYNKESKKSCGELKMVKAIYKDSIGIKKDHVVGYWVTKEYNKNYDKNVFPVFGFFNDGNFKNSQLNSFYQKSSWVKTGTNTYRITRSNYSKYSKKWSEPKVNTFKIDIQSNTATFTFTKYDGSKGSSTWYYKGKTYRFHNISDDDILKTSPITAK